MRMNGMKGKPKFSLSVQYACIAEGTPNRPRFRRWVAAALEHDAAITLRIIDEEEGRALNRDYRGRDYATNVLTFGYDHAAATLLGDIALCAPVLAREARQQGKAVEAHYAHLTVHGVLHLQGYDHQNEATARQMETLETQIVIKLGYADPYRARGD